MRALCSKIKNRVFLQNPRPAFGKWTFLKCPKTVYGHPAGPKLFPPPFIIMFVLVTVPHGYCLPSQSKRMCDTRAAASAKILTDLLTDREIKHKTITIHVPRELVDVNRDEPSLETYKNPINLSEAIKEWNKFNTRVANTIMQKKNQSILFLDIHSFPKGSLSKGNSLSKGSSFGKDTQIAILDIFKNDRPELKELVEKVRRDLQLNVKLLKGGKNYIQDKYKADAYPLLIELCEDKAYLSNKQIKDFFGLLIEWGILPHTPS